MDMKKLLLCLAGLMLGVGLHAQEKATPLQLQVYGIYDFHYATGSVGGMAAQLHWDASDMFNLGAGLEYVNSNRISGKLEACATLLTTEKGKHLTLENSYLWRHYPSLDLQEFTGALQLGWHARHADLHLGLCNRYTALLVQRSNGGNSTVLEPMNVMFAIEGWWNNQLEHPAWNAGLRWSNYNDFVIERVANWFFSVKGFYHLSDQWSLTGEAGIHPVGSLNLTASYDGWFAHLGGQLKF